MFPAGMTETIYSGQTGELWRRVRRFAQPVGQAIGDLHTMRGLFYGKMTLAETEGEHVTLFHSQQCHSLALLQGRELMLAV